MPTADRGDGLPIRFIDIDSEEKTVRIGLALLSAGYYTSALFFPVIARGKAGLRIMLRADMTRIDIENFGRQVNELRSQND
ncbi:hypothetical protein ACIHCV_22530 [Streptomyces sp. NPDC051956]|uniref:hypothetical protein n=1 Tax=Streptomyces sp. NPDC051956 TaxID=3365677 RepID=UPI0037D6B077